MPHVISSSFEADLQNGFLKPLLERVQNDHSLMLCTRKKHINIYYRGGNLIKLEERSVKHSGCRYMATFTEGYQNEYVKYYDRHYKDVSLVGYLYSQSINNESDVKKLILTIPQKKEIMDFYFSGNTGNASSVVGDPIKLENEFQQIVARENNYSKAPDMTDYFISDIELVTRLTKNNNPRFDMLALKWPTTPPNPNNVLVKLALVEMKYGSKALKGNSSILNHFNDMESFWSAKIHSDDLVQTAKKQIDQLKKFGLVKHKFRASNFEIDPDHFEIIFILANHIPQGEERESLLAELDKIKNEWKMRESDKLNLRFFTANSAGYGMYDACMMDIDKYIKLLQTR